jgi:hypothetical protein
MRILKSYRYYTLMEFLIQAWTTGTDKTLFVPGLDLDYYLLDLPLISLASTISDYTRTQIAQLQALL